MRRRKKKLSEINVVRPAGLSYFPEEVSFFFQVVPRVLITVTQD